VSSGGGGEFTACDDHAGEVLGVAVAIAGGGEREDERLVAVEFFVEDFEVGDFDAEKRVIWRWDWEDAVCGFAARGGAGGRGFGEGHGGWGAGLGVGVAEEDGIFYHETHELHEGEEGGNGWGEVPTEHTE
jgi:hypothetical protein